MRLALSMVLAVVVLSVQAAAGPIGRIKAECRDGDIVGVSGVVTACFDDCMYMEDPDRSAGVRVRGFLGTVGIKYGFDCWMGTGLMVDTGEDGEKELIYLPNTFVFGTLVDPILPLMMTNRSVGGGDLCYSPIEHCGQEGIAGCCGPNNIGLLITTTGRVTARSGLYGSYFYIDDGNGRSDGSGTPGIRVSYADLPGNQVFLPRVGDYVRVTGISTVIKMDGRMHSMIRLRHHSDSHIVVYGDGW